MEEKIAADPVFSATRRLRGLRQEARKSLGVEVLDPKTITREVVNQIDREVRDLASADVADQLEKISTVLSSICYDQREFFGAAAQELDSPVLEEISKRRRALDERDRFIKNLLDAGNNLYHQILTGDKQLVSSALKLWRSVEEERHAQAGSK